MHNICFVSRTPGLDGPRLDAFQTESWVTADLPCSFEEPRREEGVLRGSSSPLLFTSCYSLNTPRTPWNNLTIAHVCQTTQT